MYCSLLILIYWSYIKKMSTNYNYQFQKHCHDIFIDEILGVIKKDVSIVCV